MGIRNGGAGVIWDVGRQIKEGEGERGGDRGGTEL